MGAAGAGQAISGGMSLMGAMGGNDTQNTYDVGAANGLLQNSMNGALDYSANYTNQAVDAQKSSLDAALKELNQAMGTVSSGITNAFNQSQALQAPYRNAGYQALDNYQDSLHMNRYAMGSQAVAEALNNQTQVQNKIQGLYTDRQNINSLYDVGNYDLTKDINAPTLDALGKRVTEDQKLKYVKDHMTENTNEYGQRFGNYTYNGVGATDPNYAGPATGSDGNGHTVNMYAGNRTASGLEGTFNAPITSMFAAQGMPKAQDAYNQYLYNQGQLGQYLQNNYGSDRQAVANAYNRGLFNNLGTKNLY